MQLVVPCRTCCIPGQSASRAVGRGRLRSSLDCGTIKPPSYSEASEAQVRPHQAGAQAGALRDCLRLGCRANLLTSTGSTAIPEPEQRFAFDPATVCRSGDGWSEAATSCFGKRYAHKLVSSQSDRSRVAVPMCCAAFVVAVSVSEQRAALSGKALVLSSLPSYSSACDYQTGQVVPLWTTKPSPKSASRGQRCQQDRKTTALFPSPQTARRSFVFDGGVLYSSIINR